MKKILFAAVAALAITSCSQNEEIEAPSQKAVIEFNGVVEKPSRAVAQDLSTLKSNTSGFHVYAYNVTTGTASTETPIIANEAIKWDATDNLWKSTQTYYWPMDDKVMFYAYFSPKGKINELLPNSTKTYPTIQNYTVSSSIDDQEDLLVATVGPQAKTTATVTFLFNHALSQINFTIKSLKADNLTYIVKDITLTNVGSIASYDYKDGWGNATTPITYTYPLSDTDADKTVTGDATTTKKLDTDTKLILLPQTLGTDATITVGYKVLDSKNNIVYDTKTTPKVIKIGEDATVANKTWASGKKIRYTLALTNDATEIGWEVSEPTVWGSSDDPNVNKDTDTPSAS